MEIPEKGVVFRSSPSGWTFFHSCFLWLCATAMTFIYYFLVSPIVDDLPGWSLWGWAIVVAIGIWMNRKIPPRLPTVRLLRLLVIYCLSLVSLHLACSRFFQFPAPQEWIAAMSASGALVLLLESIYALRCRKLGYAVGVFPDRFEFEEPGNLRSWNWDDLAVFWDVRAREFLVTGPSRQEVRLKPDLPGRRRIVRAIEAQSGRRCKELI